jgi:adenosyl cobinamide kinase/adenosyl cobinamide phosphate guanylyltransferase
VSTLDKVEEDIHPQILVDTLFSTSSVFVVQKVQNIFSVVGLVVLGRQKKILGSLGGFFFHEMEAQVSMQYHWTPQQWRYYSAFPLHLHSQISSQQKQISLVLCVSKVL